MQGMNYKMCELKIKKQQNIPIKDNNLNKWKKTINYQ